ncbi:MAG: sialate O-acetylesterase [Planctomycetota bacterium]
MKTQSPLFLLSVCAASVVAIANDGHAELSLSRVFDNGCVLQAEKPLRVFGLATPESEIIVKIEGTDSRTTESRAITDDTGRWLAVLPPLKASHDPLQMVITGDGGVIEREELIAGDVWLFTGQSNMVWALEKTLDGADTAKDFNAPHVRFFKVKTAIQSKPQTSLAGGTWYLTDDKSELGTTSAVAAYFAQAHAAQSDSPIGVIVSALGATPLEAWAERSVLEESRVMDQTLELWDTAIRGEEPGQTLFTKYKLDSKGRRRPSGLYNGMIAPLRSLSVRGISWYQGEGNCERAKQYRTLLPMLIRSWREHFHDATLPFAVVQLAGWKAGKAKGKAVPWLRDAQAETTHRIPNTTLIVTYDTSETDGNIHPKYKKPVGQRLASWARGIVFDDREIPGPPTLVSHTINSQSITLRFRTTGDLIASSESLDSWEVAGEDLNFVPANARIVSKNQIVVTSKSVNSPRFVRFAWTAWPQGASIHDESDLPLAPFRTDNAPDPTRADGLP